MSAATRPASAPWMPQDGRFPPGTGRDTPGRPDGPRGRRSADNHGCQHGQALVEFVLVVPLVVLLVVAGVEYAAFAVHQGQWRRGATAIAFDRSQEAPAGCAIVSVEDGEDVLHGVLVAAGLEVGPDVVLECEWHSVTGWLDGPHSIHVPGPVR